MRQCRTCGASFEAGVLRAFCSTECKPAAPVRLTHCKGCGNALPPTRRARGICSKRCSEQANERRCTVPDCARPHVALGLCKMHWNREHGKRTLYPMRCLNCDTEHQKPRRDAKFCSIACRDRYRLRLRSQIAVWDGPPLTQIVRARARRAAEGSRTRCLFAGGTCSACARPFITADRSTTCSIRCAEAGANARRAFERWSRRGRDADGVFTLDEFMRVVNLFGNRCAYCDELVEGIPQPDHVVALARGGSNLIENILPACPACNSSKRELTPAEWAAWREATGRPPRRTSWGPDDVRVQHLTTLGAMPRRPAWWADTFLQAG